MFEGLKNLIDIKNKLYLGVIANGPHKGEVFRCCENDFRLKLTISYFDNSDLRCCGMEYLKVDNPIDITEITGSIPLDMCHQSIYKKHIYFLDKHTTGYLWLLDERGN